MAWIHLAKNKYIDTEAGSAVIPADGDKHLESYIKWMQNDGRYLDLTGGEGVRSYVICHGEMVYASSLAPSTVIERILGGDLLTKVEKKNQRKKEALKAVQN